MATTPGTCPICKRSAPPRPENTAAPFCSPRCRQVDLGAWLSEQYRVPTAEAPEENALTRERAHPNPNEEIEN